MPGMANLPPSPYFVSAPFDVAFVGGISTATFLFLWQFGPEAPSDRAYEILLFLVWIVNYPHFSATLHRLFRRRESAAQYPFTAYFLPVVVIAGTVAALVWPREFGPYFVKLMLLWSSYHFSGQTMGVSLIYARRNGIVLEGWERNALSLFVFSTYLTYMLQAGVLGGLYYGVEHPTIEIPPWMPALAGWAMFGAAGFLLAFVGSWMMRHRRIFPVMVLLPAVTQFVWFVPGLHTVNFFIYVPLFHSLQYLPIALAMHLGERAGEIRSPVTERRLLGESVRWFAVNLTGGAALFFLLPLIATWCSVERSVAIGVIAAGIQLHHFVVDGVIWKLRRTSVASPLMVNLRDLARAT